MLKYYCYRHIRLDKNVPFYIGIGTACLKANTQHSFYSRMNAKTDRNDIWSKITKKSKYRCEVVYESDSIDEIKKKEIELIALYGRICNGGMLCNMTDGGDGALNLPVEKIISIAEFNRGKKRSFESIIKMRVAKALKSRRVLEVNSGKVFESCADAERHFFGERNKWIYNCLRVRNGVMKKRNFKFKYID